MILSNRLCRRPLLGSIFFSLTIVATLAAAGEAIGGNLALEDGFHGQYHFAAIPVSPAVLLPVSVVESSLNITADRRPEMALDSAAERTEQAGRKQYHREVRLQIGLGLGAAYVLFLVCWFWATRVRPRRR
jgi:hypothetical protein